MNPSIEDAFLYFKQGNDCLKTEKFSDAVKFYIQAIALMPSHPIIQFHLGLAYYQLQEFEHAKTQFEKVLSLDHNFKNVNQCLANTLLELRDHDTALHYYFRQLENDPWFETYYNIGVLYMMKDRFKEALTYFEQALKKNPNDVTTYLNCGSIYLKQNRTDLAMSAYQKAVVIKPDDPEITHILSALTQEKISSTAPKEYVSHLFDQYAPYYDKHLSDRLQYSAPKKMLDVFLLYAKKNMYVMMDLGCGTGLCGELFKPHASKIIGVDLSEKMLAIARKKNLYDELLCDDVTQALQQATSADAILAGDVFTYIGDLQPVVVEAARILTSNGLFIFTVEATHHANFILQSSIRYAHKKSYINTVLMQANLAVLDIQNIVLRTQQGKPVEGYLVVAQKTR